MSIFGNFTKKIADRYPPSLSEGSTIAMFGAVILGAGAAAFGVCAIVGAGAALLLGGSALAGAIWGGGIVAAGTAAAASYFIGPSVLKILCYNHEMKKRAAAGEDVSGTSYAAGIKIDPASQLGGITANQAFGSAVAPGKRSSSRSTAPVNKRANNSPPP
jgi:hypothetical protein